MKSITIELPDDMADWLESWKAFSPEPPHAPLSVQGKILACIHEVMSEDDRSQFRDEMVADEARDVRPRWVRITSAGRGTTPLAADDNIPF